MDEKPSPPPEPAPLPSPHPQADELSDEERALLEKFDTFATLRNKVRAIADRREEWAGIPIPLHDIPLTIEPRYPFYEALVKSDKTATNDADAGLTIRNSWYSTRLRGVVFIYEENGKIKHFVYHNPPHTFAYAMLTLGASYAWGIEQEARAVKLLAEMVKPHTFKQYLLTGMFMETSKRSGLTYVFRKLRPTIVLDARAQDPGSSTRILCTLCLHPIGYYQGSWAGAMCPTDDVIAHLMLMRGDEHMLWKRANQHPPYKPEAGL